MCASFAVKPTATRFKRVLTRNRQGCLVGWRRQGHVGSSKGSVVYFCNRLLSHPPDGYPFWPLLRIHLRCSYTEQWVQFFPNSESVIRGTMASLDIVLSCIYSHIPMLSLRLVKTRRKIRNGYKSFNRVSHSLVLRRRYSKSGKTRDTGIVESWRNECFCLTIPRAPRSNRYENEATKPSHDWLWLSAKLNKKIKACFGEQLRQNKSQSKCTINPFQV